MSEDRKKIIAKLIKIKALAERGVGGEQATAQLMYDTLKKRYGITDEEVSRTAGGTVDITEIDLKQCWGACVCTGCDSKQPARRNGVMHNLSTYSHRGLRRVRHAREHKGFADTV